MSLCYLQMREGRREKTNERMEREWEGEEVESGGVEVRAKRQTILPR